MASLRDIASSTSVEAVRIDGKRYLVRGLNGNALALIVARFPELGSLLGGAIAGVSIPALIAQFGAAIGPIIAAGCGELGDEESERNAGAMLVEHQLKLVKAIIGLTFPNGLISFVEEMATLVAGADEGAKPVKIRSRKSPSPSQPSSGAASRPTMQ